MSKKRVYGSTAIDIKWYPVDFEEKMQKHWTWLKIPVGKAMKQGMNMTVAEASSNMAHYTGIGQASLKEGASHSLTQQYGSTGFKVGSYSISANIMEFGRAPNKRMPPPDSIMKWLGTSSEQFAFWAAKSIGKYGIRKTQPILKAKNTMLQKVNDLVAAAMDEVFEKLGLK